MSSEQESSRKFIVCSTNTCEDVTISAPVEIRAHADVGEIELKCMGHHIEKCTDKHAVRKFKIVQKVSVHIPLKFIVECEVKDERVDFDTSECK